MSFAPVTETVEIAGGSVVIRRLGWKALRAAEQAKQLDAIDIQKRMGVEFQQQLRDALEKAGGADKIRELAAANPHLAYDQATVLYRGIVSWTLSETPTPEQIDDLDGETADLLAKRIVALSRPKTEDERKNS